MMRVGSHVSAAGSVTLTSITGAMAALAIYKHLANIKRLIEGTEHRLGPDTTVLVDEVSQVSTRQAAQLLGEVAHAGARSCGSSATPTKQAQTKTQKQTQTTQEATTTQSFFGNSSVGSSSGAAPSVSSSTS